MGEVDEAEATLPQDFLDPVTTNAARMPDTCVRCQFRLLGGRHIVSLPGLGFSRLPHACFRRTFRRRIRTVVWSGHTATNLGKDEDFTDDCTSPIEEGQERWVSRAGQSMGQLARVK